MNQNSSESFERDHLISSIIELGVYKLKNRHLFELSMSEINHLYQSLTRNQTPETEANLDKSV
ncbi:Fur-regulated basic protein FbpA [Alkalicoccobacillus gibsonii]|uniref:Fur-regulated basic protein FbpA n=1 Tax=Alkalicoccobacillus gibsonii TaxID=79881 RepID=UPI0019345A39|nr:Fur-regulated basic protein FbpA [Alkalicoccobacillus gibsonii]MBM0066995.1 Fur-regulated basic protein FbpA [Alkalicoccobacillus gibsonii]